MNKTFTINGKQYNAVEMDFNTIADLSAMGIELLGGDFPLLKTFRAYFALCSGLNERKAGDEINAHLMNGGNLDELAEAFNDRCLNSGFMNPAKKPEIKAVQ